ncbi:hypothetical protein F383_22202 [Gossypium arboreum]|uniref:Uncharacterized protein n=1 Tax=Gossypium arboreum TaxID=29729 RepID=A0A0B0P2M5_GOSAR|nr:hypothetical protein F383_22202 [Gossypium arboreum]
MNRCASVRPCLDMISKRIFSVRPCLGHGIDLMDEPV